MQVGYVKEQPELPRAAAGRVLGGSGGGCRQQSAAVPALLPASQLDAAGANVGALGAASGWCLSSPDMARLGGGTGQDAAAAGEVCREMGAGSMGCCTKGLLHWGVPLSLSGTTRDVLEWGGQGGSDGLGQAGGRGG